MSAKIVGRILHWLFVAVLAVAVVVVAYFGIALCSILLVFFFHDREFFDAFPEPSSFATVFHVGGGLAALAAAASVLHIVCSHRRVRKNLLLLLALLIVLAGLVIFTPYILLSKEVTLNHGWIDFLGEWLGSWSRLLNLRW